MRILATIAVTLLAIGAARAAEPVYPDVSPDSRFAFPRDHGAHPDFRTEWWYVTGWLETADGEELGFQVTFFRSRLPIDDANPSRFAPRQMLFAHAALADPKSGRLVTDERIARTGFGLAEASTADAAIVLDDWRFARAVANGDAAATDPLHFTTTIHGARFALDLDLRAVGSILAEGADAAHPGYSQKGPSPRDASRYYSVPQLIVTGTVTRTRAERVTGTAWLDREWSSAYLDPRASGWDWVGLNLDDGGALMAFRMRDQAGAKLWAGGARRFADGRVERYRPEDVDFATRRSWTSPRTRATWPVAQTITIGGTAGGTAGSTAGSTAGGTGGGAAPWSIVLDPLMDDQELDSRASTGTIYWEGAVRARVDGPAGQPVGRGYLELTGYFAPIKF